MPQCFDKGRRLVEDRFAVRQRGGDFGGVQRGGARTRSGGWRGAQWSTGGKGARLGECRTEGTGAHTADWTDISNNEREGTRSHEAAHTVGNSGAPRSALRRRYSSNQSVSGEFGVGFGAVLGAGLDW